MSHYSMYKHDQDEYITSFDVDLSKQEVFQLAENKAKDLEYKSGGELEPITNNLGGRIHFLSLPEFLNTDDGSILVHDPKDFDIYLSNFKSPMRDRFTIAHEIGHYFIHSKEGQTKIKAARRGSNRSEWQANWFAAAFLMPEGIFNKVSEHYGDDIASIAGHFLVSKKAVNVRQKSLQK